MSELTELGQILHEEHFRILVSICGLESRVDSPAARPLDPSRTEGRQQLRDLLVALDGVLGHHAFEESVMFPLIRGGGKGELAATLAREHGQSNRWRHGFARSPPVSWRHRRAGLGGFP
jgi:hemerythrin-like domain-containing protein